MKAAQRPRAVHATRRSSADGPRVVHLHGYFPFDAPGAAEEKRLAGELVASDLDYHRLSNDHAAWTNRELMTLLDSRSVLIVGMSLTDPNVRRLLAYLSEHKKSQDEAHDHFVILQQRPPMATAMHQRASEMLEDDEYKFWHGQGVKILRLSSWDGLNYLAAPHPLHRRGVGSAATKSCASPGRPRATTSVDFDDATLQEFGTELLTYHRDRIFAAVGLPGRVEINLFLPHARRALPARAVVDAGARAVAAPRRFTPKHDAQTIPEVELALTVGETLKRSARSLNHETPPPPGEPPFAGLVPLARVRAVLRLPGRRRAGGAHAAGLVGRGARRGGAAERRRWRRCARSCARRSPAPCTSCAAARRAA